MHFTKKMEDLIDTNLSWLFRMTINTANTAADTKVVSSSQHMNLFSLPPLVVKLQQASVRASLVSSSTSLEAIANLGTPFFFEHGTSRYAHHTRSTCRPNPPISKMYTNTSFEPLAAQVLSLSTPLPDSNVAQ